MAETQARPRSRRTSLSDCTRLRYHRAEERFPVLAKRASMRWEATVGQKIKKWMSRLEDVKIDCVIISHG